MTKVELLVERLLNEDSSQDITREQAMKMVRDFRAATKVEWSDQNGLVRLSVPQAIQAGEKFQLLGTSSLLIHKGGDVLKVRFAA